MIARRIPILLGVLLSLGLIAVTALIVRSQSSQLNDDPCVLPLEERHGGWICPGGVSSRSAP